MMKMRYFDCLVAAGTTEAHEVIEVLLGLDMKVLATVATDLGARVLEDLACDQLVIETGRKTSDQFVSLLRDTRVRHVIDATHPFAVEVTRALQNACDQYFDETGRRLSYIRYVRPHMAYPYEKVIYTKNAAEAADLLRTIPGNFLLTTGANTVDVYKDSISDFNLRGYVRVLDTEASVSRCRACGIDGGHIIAKNPPFSEKDNDALISDLNIKALVSKDSGVTGGLPEKIASAKKAGIPVILIERPEDAQGISDRDELSRKLTDIEVRKWSFEQQ